MCIRCNCVTYRHTVTQSTINAKFLCYTFFQVDFFQTYIIEFRGREGSPLYGVEHFIEGGYVKYNSNSGFVSDVNRLTPQAFSHFTFEKSKHWLILVDIQGASCTDVLMLCVCIYVEWL